MSNVRLSKKRSIRESEFNFSSEELLHLDLKDEFVEYSGYDLKSCKVGSNIDAKFKLYAMDLALVGNVWELGNVGMQILPKSSKKLNLVLETHFDAANGKAVFNCKRVKEVPTYVYSGGC